MPKPKSTRRRLFAILNAIHHIELNVRDMDQAAFTSDHKTYRAVERELEIISEASRSLTPEQKAQHPEIPWRRIADIGNVLRHNYDDVAPRLIWEVVANHLGALKQAAQSLYRQVKRPADPWPDAEPE
ncbi:MAG: HepT-like ribonuclease domain-containing protein [Vitreimonas sp.]